MLHHKPVVVDGYDGSKRGGIEGLVFLAVHVIQIIPIPPSHDEEVGCRPYKFTHRRCIHRLDFFPRFSISEIPLYLYWEYEVMLVPIRMTVKIKRKVDFFIFLYL